MFLVRQLVEAAYLERPPRYEAYCVTDKADGSEQEITPTPQSIAFGDRIREAREEAGLTQGQAANKIGMGQSYWSKIERGKLSPTRKTILQLCTALDISPSSLFAQDILTIGSFIELLADLVVAIKDESSGQPMDSPLTMDILRRAIRRLGI